MIPRLLEKTILEKMADLRKIMLILGPRQAGKTTLLKSLWARFERQGKKVLYLNLDLEEDKNVFNTTSLTILQKLLVNTQIVLVDEAQQLDNPGLTLKIIYDHLPQVQILATGSSSLDLKNRLSDPLTGRYLDFKLYPLSITEIVPTLSLSNNPVLQKEQFKNLLPQLLLYGAYPEVYLTAKTENKSLLLAKICESYLFKDIFAFQKVKSPQIIKDLSRALAYQIGSEVNENELSNRLKIDRKTVVYYLDLLEKTFVIFKLRPFSKNPRREIGRNYKVYFVDLGIRNALIDDFNPLSVRPDTGVLWENFLIAERQKKHAHTGNRREGFFWRSYQGAEVDYLEKDETGQLNAFEIKYTSGSLSKGASSFYQKYKTPIELINQGNFWQFVK